MTALEIQHRPSTIDDLLALQSATDKSYELVNGHFVEEPDMGALADQVALKVGIRLGLFAEKTGGQAFGSQTTYAIFNDESNGRRPDTSYVAPGRLPGNRTPVDVIRIPPDVAVEVVSPNDRMNDVMGKVDLYLRHKVGQVWIVLPETRQMFICTADASPVWYRADQTFTGTGVLEGLSFPLASIFPPVSEQQPAGQPK